jgi:hypothetical protein
MSNHLGDTNKMVSETLRTDGLLTAILDSDGFVHNGNCPQRWVNYARELERELNAANDRIKRLEEALEGTVKWIVHLADSGDAGFWNPEEQPEIIAARAALKKESKP